jgi:glycosyltransferase involved in cell wall biosynthesis
MKKKICHVITRFINGGAEENTMLTCNYSIKLGDNVTLIIGKETNKEILYKLSKKIKVIKINNLVRDIDPIKDILAFFEIKRIFNKLKPDIVHTHESKAGILGRIAAKISRVNLIVHTVHILPFVNVKYYKKYFYILIEKLTSYITDKFICVSKGMLIESLKFKIGNKEKYKIIHSGFDIKKFKYTKKEPKIIKINEYNKNPKKFKLILMMGAFEERKRQIEFLHIFKKIIKIFDKTILVFVGSGKLLNKTKRLSSDLGLKKRVYFSGFRNDPEKFISLSDICVMNSVREGLPKVVPQYYSAGKPVISTNLPGIQEIISHSKNGYIYNPYKQNELFKILKLLLEKPEELKKITKNAKKTNVSKWSHIKMPIKINDLYDELLNDHYK